MVVVEEVEEEEEEDGREIRAFVAEKLVLCCCWRDREERGKES